MTEYLKLIFRPATADHHQYTIKLLKQGQNDKHIGKGDVENMENYSMIMWFKIALIVLKLLGYQVLAYTFVFGLNFRENSKIRWLH